LYIFRKAEYAAGALCAGVLGEFQSFVYFGWMTGHFWPTVVDWMERNMLTCPSKRWFHVECPGCGMQRSIIALFRGDIPASLRLYPATIPLLLLVGYVALHVKYDFRNGATVIKYLYLGVATIVLVFYIYKVLNHKLID
jgi:hypothetical protein